MYVHIEGKYGFKRCASVFVLKRVFFVFDLGERVFSSLLVVSVIAQVQLSVQKQLNKTKSMVYNTRNTSNADTAYMLHSP